MNVHIVLLIILMIFIGALHTLTHSEGEAAGKKDPNSSSSGSSGIGHHDVHHHDHMNHHNKAIFPNRPVVDWPQGTNYWTFLPVIALFGYVCSACLYLLLLNVFVGNLVSIVSG